MHSRVAFCTDSLVEGPLHVPPLETQNARLEDDSGVPSAAVGLAHSSSGQCLSSALLGLTQDELVTCPVPPHSWRHPVPGRVLASHAHF